MADHLSEEEQIEAFKGWWAENGLQTIAALILVIGGYFGWQFWQDRQLEQVEQASDLYVEMIEIVSSQADGGRLSLEKEVAVGKLVSSKQSFQALVMPSLPLCSRPSWQWITKSWIWLRTNYSGLWTVIQRQRLSVWSGCDWPGLRLLVVI